MQSKTHSLLEAISNILIGLVINITFQAIVFPWFGIHIPLHDNIMIALIFTVVSLCRQYVLRRFWNHLTKKVS